MIRAFITYYFTPTLENWRALRRLCMSRLTGEGQGGGVSHPFDFVPCKHEPQCPGWWNCARRGCYISAAARMPDHRDGYRRGFGEGSHGQPSTDGRLIGSEYPQRKDSLE